MINTIIKRIGGFLGVASAITGIASWNPDFTSAGTIIIIGSLSALITFSLIEYIRRKLQKSIPFGCCGIPGYGIRMAVPADLEKICDLQEHFYGNDAVPLKLYQEWFNANPDGFFILQRTTFEENNSIKKELVGHFTLLSIKPDIFDVYRGGNMLETGIEKRHLYGSHEKNLMKTIYVESLMIEDDELTRSEGMRVIIRMMDTMLSKFCGEHVPDYVYAMAATDNGSGTLKKWGFNEDSYGKLTDERLDGHPMFVSGFQTFRDRLKSKEQNLEMNLLEDKLKYKFK